MVEVVAAHLHEVVGGGDERDRRIGEQRPAALSHRGPVVRGEEVQRRRHREVGRRVARPLPAVRLGERGALDEVPRDDERLDQGLRLGPRVEKAGSLRRAQPFVAVPGVDVGLQGVELEVELPRRVRTVDDRERAVRPRERADAGDVVHAAGRPLHVRAEDDPGARPRNELRERPPHECRAGAAGDVLPEDLEAAVLRVAEQHLVAGAEAERAGDGVQPRGRVRDERQPLGIGPNVLREPCANGVQERGQPPFEGEELHGLPLELALRLLVGVEDGPRRRPERAVVEEDDRRVEEEELLHGVRNHDCSLLIDD